MMRRRGFTFFLLCFVLLCYGSAIAQAGAPPLYSVDFTAMSQGGGSSASTDYSMESMVTSSGIDTTVNSSADYTLESPLALLTYDNTGSAVGYASSIELTWTEGENADAIVGYLVLRSATGEAGSFESLQAEALSGTSYTDSSPIAGGTNYYMVYAVDSDGDTFPWTDAFTGDVATPTPTETPTETPTPTATPSGKVSRAADWDKY